MIKTLEELRQGTKDPFLRDLIDTVYHWRTPQEAPRRGKTGRVETITETPQTFQEAAKQLVYWGGILERPKVLVDIGDQVGDTGSGALTRISGAWQLIDYLTQNEGDVRYANRFHAPTHQWDGDDPLVGQQIAGLKEEDRPMWAAVRLDPNAPTPPTRRIGDIFWDPDNHCHSFVLEGSDTIWQGPMEDLLYGHNDSGAPHLNGMVGYIKGSQGQRPTIDISRADDRLKSLAVVFATEASIAANNSGYYTSRGFVRDVNTSGMTAGSPLWLQLTGGYGTSKPSPGLNVRNVSLGHVVRSHATTGSVFADITAYPFVDELSGVGISGLKDGHQLAFNGTYWQNQPSRMHRWPINQDLSYEFTLSYSSAIRRPVLTPTGSVFYCWMNGERLTFTGTQSLPQHPNVTGQYFYYVDSAGTFQYGTSGFDLFTMVPICIVEWDATKVDGWCRPELHTTEISALLHQREHDVDGSEIAMRSGFSISGYTYDLDTVAGVTFGVSGGILWDEDARSVIASLADGSSYSMFYKSGASGAWTWDDGMTLPYKQGTTYPTVNTYTGGTWTQTEIDGTGSAVFFNVFVVAAPCVNKAQMILVQGQGSFASQALAEAQTWDTMDLSGLAWKEFVPVYQVIYKSQAAWSATTKKTRMALAKKITKGSGSAGVGASNEHNALTGRDALDAHPSLSITDIYALSVGSILKRSSLGITAAIPDTDYAAAHSHPYLPINNPEFTGDLRGAGSMVWRSAGGTHYFSQQGGASDWFIRDLNAGGTVIDYPFVIVKGASGQIRIGSDGSIRPLRIGGAITNDSLIGTGTRGLVATSAGIIQAQDSATFLSTIGAASVSHTHSFASITSKPTTISGYGITIVASDLPNHASRHQFGGVDALAGQSISGLRTSDSPTFANLNIGEVGAIIGVAGTNDFWRIKGFSSGTDNGYLEIATSDNGTEQIVFRQYNGGDYGFTSIARTLTLLSSSGETELPVKLTTPLARVTGLSTGFVRSDANGNLSSSALTSGELPNHASRHHWNGADPLTGQSISGLMTTDTPIFYGVELGDGGIGFSGASGIALNGFGEIVIRPPSGLVKFIVSDTEASCSNAFSAASGRFSNLSTGFVRSNGIGQLSSSALLASELPNHAPRHHWDGADPLTGQSINGLRTSDSPRFYNLTVDGELRLPSYYIYNYDGKLSFETSLYNRMAYMDSTGFYEEHGIFPLENGLECGRDTLRWNFRSNDTNHEVEIVNATEGGAGTNIASIPATGNYFRLSAPTSGQYKNYRVPDNTSWIGKELVLTCTSTDPNGFLRVYPPNSGDLFVDGQAVSYIDFVWGTKLVLHSDGFRWYV